MMARRLYLCLFMILSCVCVQAGIAVGTWKQYPVFGEVTDLIDTDRYVWYATGGCLYSYDKDADETRFYSGCKDLTGATVKFIRHDRDSNVLAVAFADGNIDMIFPDGSLVNFPEIRDAGSGINRTVNDIRFDRNEMFVTTGSGLVIYDIGHREVKESRIYNMPLRTVIPTPQYLFLACAENENGSYALYRVRRDASINSFDNLAFVCRYRDLIDDFCALDDSGTRYAVSRNGRLDYIDIDSGGGCVFHDIRLNGSYCHASGMSADGSGVVRFISSDGVVGHYGGSGSLVADKAMPEEFRDNLMASCRGLASVWLAGPDGIGNYRIGKDLTVLREKSVPSDAITFNRICNIFPTSDKRGFYIANLGLTMHHPSRDGLTYGVKLNLNCLDRSQIKNIVPIGATANSVPGMGVIASGGNYIFSPTQIDEDPDIPDRLFIGSGTEGVYVVDGNDVVLKIDGNNSPMKKIENYFWGVTGVKIDDCGNLWVAYNIESGNDAIMVLPADKRCIKDIKNIKIEDWHVASYGGFIYARDIKFLHCKYSDMMFVIDSAARRGFLAVNHRGTLDDPADDTYVGWSYMTDQDGNTFTPQSWTCLVEDHRGHVWFGTTSGVISVTDPSRACDSGFRINRIKVPRNDGSGLADYLLGDDHIVAIAVDSSNRKWIGTNGSGLYLVSEDGDEIISHFTTGNSPLPTNIITALYCDPNSNSLFVGTLSGLYEYSSASSPPAPDYSDVYAYPNPVTPEYSGPITVTGLMDNSLVKIMDSGMRLVYQTTSEGGMAVWNGCDAAGQRVHSGVYYVLASSSGQSSGSSSGDAVAKILVVN